MRLDTIAFQYSLADGRRGIAVASVPEPGGLGLLGVVFAALFRRRRPERGAVSDSKLPRRE